MSPHRKNRASDDGAMSTLVKIFATTLGLLLLVGLFTLMLNLFGSVYGVALLVIWLSLLYGLMLFGHLEYRRGRRGELLQLLAAAVESRAPLAPAVRVFVEDRPRSPLRDAIIAVPLFVLLPGYYFLIYRSFDRLVEDLANRLEAGESLVEALNELPQVISREGLLAVEVGHLTGQLGICLRRTAKEEKAINWIEPVIRAFYALVVVFVASSVTAFWSVLIEPRMWRIFADFQIAAPAATVRLGQSAWGIGLLALGMALFELSGLLLLNRTLRWYCPVIGRLYRLFLQGRLSRSLGLMLEAGLPAPKALALLADSTAFPDPMRARLETALNDLSRGEALGPSLQAQGLLPGSMVPLTQAAERANNLPPTLQTMGDHLSMRAIRLVRRISLMMFPASVIAVGALVAFLVAGMFLPLIQIIEGMAE